MNNKSAVLISLVIMLAGGVWATTHQVSMVGFNFVPETLAVQVGDTVNWKNNSTMNHTTTSGVGGVPNGIWDSGLIVPGDSFRFAFSIPDSYPYYCIPHWQLGMTGLIIVTATGIQDGDKQNSGGFSFEVAPNPFRVKTDVRLQITDNSSKTIDLQIFDISGRLVKRFSHSVADIGHPLSVIWSGDDDRGRQVSPGVYFIKPERETAASIRKVVKLK